MGKRGPKKLSTETLLKRGSPLGKKRLREEREAKRKRPYIPPVADDADPEATAAAIAADDGVPEDITALIIEKDIWECNATVDVSDVENIRIEITSDEMVSPLLITFNVNEQDKEPGAIGNETSLYAVLRCFGQPEKAAKKKAGRNKG